MNSFMDLRVSAILEYPEFGAPVRGLKGVSLTLLAIATASMAACIALCEYRMKAAGLTAFIPALLLMMLIMYRHRP